jgi:dolichol-phosphate mannosyltransferase
VRYRAIRLTKNFGFQNSILANYREAKGDAVIQLDADLQDPIEVVHEFIAFWEQGIQIVLGRRLKRKERYTISLMRRIGYWMISFLADIRIEQNVGDFRLLDREVVNTLISTRHPRPYLRGLVSNLGFSSAIVEFNREKRMHGESKFPILDLFKMGITALLNHSKLPERLMQSVTLVSIIGSTAGAVYYLVARFIQTDWPKGFASLYVLLLLSIALNAVFSLIMFRYIRQIHLIATGEPNYIIGQRIN